MSGDSMHAALLEACGTVAAQEERLEIVTARCERLFAALKALHGLVDRKAYMTPEEMHLIWYVGALIAEGL
jgi:hypothetical protein